MAWREEYSGSDESQEDRQVETTHPGLKTIDKGGAMMCEEVHRHLAISCPLCNPPPHTLITGQGVEMEARKWGFIVKNIGVNIL